MGTDTTTSWCPTCGAEYRAGISECAECSVGLVPGRPESLPCPEPPDEIRYDLGTWTDDQRTALRWLLESEHIDAVWDGTDVIVIDANEARVDDLVTWMEAQPTVSEEFGQVASAIRPNATSPPRSGSRPFGESGAIAGPGRRLFGFAVDWLVTGAIMSAVVIPTAIHESGGRGAHLTTQVWIAWNIVLLAYYVVPVAIWGRTPGKIAAGTRVVRTSDLTLPGWALRSYAGWRRCCPRSAQRCWARRPGRGSPCRSPQR